MFYQFLQDSEEEEAWLVEKIRIVRSTDVGKDLQSVTSLLKKHQVSGQARTGQDRTGQDRTGQDRTGHRWGTGLVVGLQYDSMA